MADFSKFPLLSEHRTGAVRRSPLGQSAADSGVLYGPVPLGVSGLVAPVAAVSLRGIRPSPVRSSRRSCTVQGGARLARVPLQLTCADRASPCRFIYKDFN